MIILSNNPAVWEAYPGAKQIKGSVVMVLKKARDLIHMGHKLATHPLAGSVKPNQTPYKSVALESEAGRLDLVSLQIIENSIALSVSLLQDKPLLDWSEANKADLQLIDKELLDNILN